MLRYTSNLILLLLFSTLVCSAQEADTVIRNKFLPTGIRFSTDLVSIVQTIVDDDYSGWEVSADVDFYRYFFTLEAGQWSKSFKTDDEDYKNDGSYWRTGVDINFLKNDPEKNMFFLGARYASSTFNEILTIGPDDTWTTGTLIYNNKNTKASWVELTGGLKVKMWKYLWLGYTARFKFALDVKGETEMAPHDIPGFGSTNKNNTWGFNYLIMIRIPFVKEKKIKSDEVQ